MALTPDDAKNINTALNALGRSLKDEIAKLPEKGRPEQFDDAFLKKISECYMSDRGVLALLADSRLDRGTNCLCGCSCAEPSHGIVTW